MKNSSKKYALPGALLAVLIGLSPLTAAQQVKLRVADSLPAGHFMSEYATKFWMKEVSRLTNNEAEFEYYPAEQMGKAKDLLALTQSGVVDIGYVVPSYVSDKMPLTAAAELPGEFFNSCAATLAYWKLARNDGILAKKEYAANGVRILFGVVMPPYQAFTGKQKIDSIKSLSGLKLRTAGGAMDATARRFHGVPVRMGTPELYESLSRGTVDGMLLAYASLISYDLVGLVKYGTVGENFGSAVITYVISEARWKKLPSAIQKAMTEAGDAATRRVCNMVDKDVESDIEKIRRQGVTLVHLPDTERKEISAAMDGVSVEWAQNLDKRGKPGTEVLKAYREALKAK